MDTVVDTGGHGGQGGGRPAIGRRKSPNQQARDRVGPWPVKVSARRNGLAAKHARIVWDEARAGMGNRAEGLWTASGRNAVAFAGQVDLAFLATVAAHLRRCETCWKTWVDGEVPAELLTAAVRRTRAGEVWKALEREIRAQRGRGGRQ